MENIVLFTLDCELEMRSRYDGVYLPHSLSCGGDNVIVLDVSIIPPQVDFHSNFGSQELEESEERWSCLSCQCHSCPSSSVDDDGDDQKSEYTL